MDGHLIYLNIYGSSIYGWIHDDELNYSEVIFMIIHAVPDQQLLSRGRACRDIEDTPWRLRPGSRHVVVNRELFLAPQKEFTSEKNGLLMGYNWGLMDFRNSKKLIICYNWLFMGYL